MKLCKLRFEQHYINPWGHRELSTVHRVIEIVDVWENGEFKMFDNGYEPPYACPVWESNDGRTWVAVANHVDYWGGIHYTKLFEEPMDSTFWETYDNVVKMKLVNEALLAVDIEGNVL